MTSYIKLWTNTSDKTLMESTLTVIPQALIRGRHRVTDTVPDFGDFVVLATGGKVVKMLADLGIVPKGRTITSLRGKVFNVGQAKILITYSPDIVETDPTRAPDVLWDAQLALRLATTGSLDPVVGEHYHYTDNFDAVETYLDAQPTPVPLCGDLETLGLDPYAEAAWIVSIQFSAEEGTGYVMRFVGQDDPTYPPNNPKILGQIDRILNHPMARIRGANFKFDLLWLWVHWSLTCDTFTMDTTIVGSLLDENRSNGLSNHARIYTAMGGYDDELNSGYDKGRMDLVPDAQFLTYSAGDVDACLQVSNKLAKGLSRRPKLHRFYTQLLHPAMLAFHDMEKVGVCVDADYLRDLGEEIAGDVAALTERAKGLLPRRLQLRHSREFRLSRGVITKDFLFSRSGLNLTPLMVTEKAEEPSTAMEHLSMFADHPEAGPWVQLLQQQGKLSKIRGTYIDGFLKHLRTDGRFHPSAMLFKGAFEGDAGVDMAGTVTGRTSFRDPAIQTIPKHGDLAPRLRRAYVAPPGYVIVSLDYSQGELRVTACIADEPTMIKAYREGVDLHALTGGHMIGMTPNDMLKLHALANSGDLTAKDRYKQIRQNGKSANFGLIYGMGGPGYEEYAWQAFQVKLEPGVGMKQRDLFFDTYDKLPNWHGASKREARANGFVVSPLGRERHLPLIRSADNGLRSKAERQAINSPVQSTLSDLALLAMALFRERYAQPAGCQPFAMIHDNIAFYVKEDEVDLWVPRIRECMEDQDLTIRFGWEHQLDFPSDWEMGVTMGDMKEMKS